METHRKLVVVTGATSGIGLATTERLVRAGVDVIGVGQSAERCRAAQANLQKINPAVQVLYLTADLSVQAEVRELAQRIKEYLARTEKTSLDGLVNNAGVFTYWFMLTPDGIEKQWAVNHLAAFLLTTELLPLLEVAPHGRVVTVSSGSHYGAHIPWEDPQLRRHYNALRAYGITKLANVLFTLELNRRLAAGSHVRAFAVDPGLVNTDMGLKNSPAVARLVWRMRRSSGTAPDVPAQGITNLLLQSGYQNGSGVYWKDSRQKTESPAARDVSSAQRLWVLSEKLCGIEGGD